MNKLFRTVVFLSLLQLTGCSLFKNEIYYENGKVSAHYGKGENGKLTIDLYAVGLVEESSLLYYLEKSYSKICEGKKYRILSKEYAVLISEGKKLPNETSFFNSTGDCIN